MDLHAWGYGNTDVTSALEEDAGRAILELHMYAWISLIPTGAGSDTRASMYCSPGDSADELAPLVCGAL